MLAATYEGFPVDSVLWFAFGCIVLFSIHRVVSRVCKAAEVTSNNEHENWKAKVDMEHEKRLATESTERTHVTIKERLIIEKQSAQQSLKATP